MQIKTEKKNGFTLARLSGEFGADDAPTIAEELHPVIGEAGAALILDLAGVTWIDSSGLSSLISLVTHARLSNSRVILVNPDKFVAGVLEVTNLDKWFEIADNLQNAEQKLAQEAEHR